MATRPRQPRYTVSGRTILSLLRYGEGRGVDVGVLERELEFDRAALAHPDTRITQAQSHRVWHWLAERLDAPHFGLDLAQQLDLDGLDVLGHLAVNCATVREMLDCAVRYARILHDAGRVEYEVMGQRVRIYPGCRGLSHAVPRDVAEYSAALVLQLAKHATGADLRVKALAFRHGPPQSLTRLKAVFGVTPTFHAAETSLTLDAAVLDWPVAGRHAGVVTYLDRYAQQFVARLPAESQGTLADEVRRLLAVGLEKGVVTAARVAKQLALHPRTLQRRLGAEGHSVSALLDETRRALAERFLADERLGLAEVAYLLGYTEVSAFHRAFKRWHHLTPAAFRARAPMKRNDGGPTGRSPPPRTPAVDSPRFSRFERPCAAGASARGRGARVRGRRTRSQPPS